MTPDQTTTRHLILGIDPGLGGALAFFDTRDRTIHALYDVPVVKEKNGDHVVNIYELAAIVQTHADETLCAIIEEVGAAPKQGLSSTFKFGRTAGILAGVVSSSFIPIYFVKPAVWKVGMGLQTNATEGKGAKTFGKAESTDMAKALFPEAAGKYFLLKKHHDRAEACLIAFFGEKMMELTSRVREGRQKNGYNKEKSP